MQVTRTGVRAGDVDASQSASTTSTVGAAAPPPVDGVAPVSVEAHPEAQTASASTPTTHDDAMGTVCAGSLCATGGHGLQVTADSVRPELQRALHAGEGPLSFLTGERPDVGRATALLEQLAPAEFTKSLEGLGSRDRATLLTSGTPAQRHELLQLAVKQGYLESNPRQKCSGAAGAPPGQPEMFRNDPRLPDEVRQAVHQQNQANVQAYQKDYQAYVARYAVAVGQVKSTDELRALGPPARPTEDLNEPGVMGQDLARFPNTSRHFSASVLPAYRAVADQVNRLEGKPVGNFSLVAEADVELEMNHRVFGARVGGGVDAEGHVATRQVARRGYGAEGVKLTEDTRGNLELEAERHGSGFKVKHDQNGELEELGVTVGGKGAELGKGGKLTFKAEFAEVSVDPERGTFTQAIKKDVEAEVGGVRARASFKVGLQARGLSKEDARAMVKGGGVFGDR